MKIKNLILATALTAVTSTVFPFSYYEADKGQVGDGGIMGARMIFIPPVTTNISVGDNIEVIFTNDIGVVYGMIKNHIGVTIAQAKTDTSTETIMNLNIANLPSGTYTFIITTTQGSTVKSEKFTVE